MVGIIVMFIELVKSYQGVIVVFVVLFVFGCMVIGICFCCGKNVVEGKKSFFCEGWNVVFVCDFVLWKNDCFFISKYKELICKVVVVLLKKGCVVMIGLFFEKKGVFYDVIVVMEDIGEKFVCFKLEFDNNIFKKKGN